MPFCDVNLKRQRPRAKHNDSTIGPRCDRVGAERPGRSLDGPEDPILHREQRRRRERRDADHFVAADQVVGVYASVYPAVHLAGAFWYIRAFGDRPFRGDSPSWPSYLGEVGMLIFC